ncbi:hypothetical protein F4808DRAFT_437316 [Astrocystis sublimbata]|nr:hypothetical protein F4808DRAFT_437316 [Astrocystis sublimbata]
MGTDIFPLPEILRFIGKNDADLTPKLIHSETSFNMPSSIRSLALVLLMGLSGGMLQTAEAAVIEPMAVKTTKVKHQATVTSTAIPTPWPSEPTYHYTSQCVLPATAPGNCQLSAHIGFNDAGFVPNYCQRLLFTETKTQTLKVDCGGCNQLTASQVHGGCPKGIPPPNPVPTATFPFYVYRFECATSAPSYPTVTACAK